jgi:hypothetical protein
MGRNAGVSPLGPSRFSWERARVWGPGIVLLAVAAMQIVLAKTADLSPWKGGGFGMFATTDGTAFRHIRIFVEAPGRSEELVLAPSQEFAAARAQLFPSDTLLTRLARAVANREQRYGRSVATVRLEVWRTEFTPVTLDPADHRLREFVWRVDSADRRSR